MDLTIHDLATVTGVSEATLSRVENGRTDIGASNLCRFARALRVDVSAFFGGEGLQIAQGTRSILQIGTVSVFQTGHFTTKILGVDLF